MMQKEGQKKRKSHDSSAAASKKGKHSSSKATEALSSSAQKRQVRKDRQSHRRHAETVEEAKVLWNKLRLKTNSKDVTEQLMEQLMELIRGKVNQIALQHDASRIVQAAIQFGNDKQRKELLTEICQSEGGLVELSKIQYARFCCMKFINYCRRDEACVKMIIKSFKGEMSKLAVHGVASQVVEYMFQHLPPKSLAPLKQEFYGPHFSLFATELSGPSTLENNLKNAKTDTQKEAAINFVKDLLNKGMTKGFYGHVYFQQLFAEYVDVADPSDIRVMASTAADHSPQLLSTRHGARVVATLAAYGTPKDRKRICKSLKGFTASSLLHRDAYLAVLRLIQVTDDTVSIHKSLLNEILTTPTPVEGNEQDGDTEPSGMLALALSETGSKLFLMILVKDDDARMKYFDPYERSILEPTPYITENGKEVLTSKKDPELRRQELLKHVAAALLDMCVEHVGELITSVPGSRVLKEVYCQNPSEKLARAISEECLQSLESSGSDDDLSLFEHTVSHRCIKNMIMYDANDNGIEPMLSNALVSSLGENLSVLVESNRGSFVAAALLGVPSVHSKVQDKLSIHKKEVKTKSKAEDGATAGYAAVLKALES